MDSTGIGTTAKSFSAKSANGSGSVADWPVVGPWENRAHEAAQKLGRLRSNGSLSTNSEPTLSSRKQTRKDKGETALGGKV